MDFKHHFGFSRICFSLICFPQQNTCKSNDEPMKTRFVPKIHKNRSTAGNRNYKDWGGPPNQFSHRRARNLLLSIIACPCAKYTNPTPPGWGRGISGGRAVGFQLVELDRALAKDLGPLSQDIFKPKGVWGEISLPACMLSHLAKNDDLRMDRERKT